MDVLQILVQRPDAGRAVRCIAVGFSLVWGVLNIINILHGSLIILGAYLAYFAWQRARVPPAAFARRRGASLRARLAAPAGLINRVMAPPVLTTLTLTFGLDMILYNAMISPSRPLRAVSRRSAYWIWAGRDREGSPVCHGARARADLLLYLLLRASRSAARSWRCAWTAMPRP